MIKICIYLYISRSGQEGSMSSKGSSSGSKGTGQLGNARGRSDQQQVAEMTLEQLQRENVELRNQLAECSQEIVLLNEVISTVGSTLKLDEVLRHLVDTIVRAISCHAAFIYLYDSEKERLILASTSEQYQHRAGKIQLALGEGIVGWVAL